MAKVDTRPIINYQELMSRKITTLQQDMGMENALSTKDLDMAFVYVLD